MPTGSPVQAPRRSDTIIPGTLRRTGATSYLGRLVWTDSATLRTRRPAGGWPGSTRPRPGWSPRARERRPDDEPGRGASFNSSVAISQSLRPSRISLLDGAAPARLLLQVPDRRATASGEIVLADRCQRC